VTVRRLASLAGALVVATIAALASYSHMRGLSMQHGQPEWIANLLPVSVDGMMLVATVALGDGRRNRWSAWLAFWTGVVASVLANVLAAQPSVIARCISAWPALAFLLVVEIITRGGRASPAVAPRITGTADGERAARTVSDGAQVVASGSLVELAGRLRDANTSTPAAPTATGPAAPTPDPVPVPPDLAPAPNRPAGQDRASPMTAVPGRAARQAETDDRIGTRVHPPDQTTPDQTIPDQPHRTNRTRGQMVVAKGSRPTSGPEQPDRGQQPGRQVTHTRPGDVAETVAYWLDKGMAVREICAKVDRSERTVRRIIEKLPAPTGSPGAPHQRANSTAGSSLADVATSR
jgi:hypothetical protein